MGFYDTTDDNWLKPIITLLDWWSEKFRGARFTILSIILLILISFVDHPLEYYMLNGADNSLGLMKSVLPILVIPMIILLFLLILDFFAFFMFHLNPLDPKKIQHMTFEDQKISNENQLQMMEAEVITTNTIEIRYHLLKILFKIITTAMIIITIFGFLFKGVSRVFKIPLIEGIYNSGSITDYFCFSALNFTTLGMNTNIEHINAWISRIIVSEVLVASFFGVICVTLSLSYIFQIYSSYPSYMSHLYRSLLIEKNKGEKK